MIPSLRGTILLQRSIYLSIMLRVLLRLRDNFGVLAVAMDDSGWSCNRACQRRRGKRRSCITRPRAATAVARQQTRTRIACADAHESCCAHRPGHDAAHHHHAQPVMDRPQPVFRPLPGHPCLRTLDARFLRVGADTYATLAAISSMARRVCQRSTMAQRDAWCGATAGRRYARLGFCLVEQHDAVPGVASRGEELDVFSLGAPQLDHIAQRRKRHRLDVRAVTRHDSGPARLDVRHGFRPVRLSLPKAFRPHHCGRVATCTCPIFSRSVNHRFHFQASVNITFVMA